MLVVAVVIFIRRKKIWDSYCKNYVRRPTALGHFLYQPYPFVYYAHAYFVCPVLFLLGLYFIQRGW